MTRFETDETLGFKQDCWELGTVALHGSFEHRLAEKYDVLSERLRQAGDFVADNPVDTATRSLRSVASESGLAPATFSRLARVLEYESFEELREVIRRKIDRRVNSIATRADRLQHDHREAAESFFERHRLACLANLEALATSVDTDRLERAVDRLHKARRVVLVGALGSTGITEYMSYMANFLTSNWELAGRMGASMGSALAGLDERDALLIVTKPPFARKSLLAAATAREQGAHVIVITDSHTCPALRHAETALLVQSGSPHFFSSFVATVFLVETIIGMLAGRAGPEATERIAQVENRNRRLEEVGGG